MEEKEIQAVSIFPEGWNWEEMEDRIGKNQCPVCGTPLVPDLEAVAWSGPLKDKWDEHTYRSGCGCMPENVRISIG